MPTQLRDQLTRLLGVEIEGPMVAVGRGYTPALRRLVRLADGRRVFVKAATNTSTAQWLRDEQRIYAQLEAPFLARHVAFADGERPVMVLEDLSTAHWPPDWRAGDIEAVRAAMAAISAHSPAHIPPIDADTFQSGWQRVAADPAPFLSLGHVSAAWLSQALPQLIAATMAVDLSGDALLHCDLRSDNLCLRGGRAILVDWNYACRGNPDFDIAFWLPSLAMEGGGLPESILPAAPGLAALVSGFFACRAGLPIIPHAPRVRHIQQVQLSAALPWAIRALGLSTP